MSKSVPVIPFPGLDKLSACPIIFQHLFHFLVCESEMLMVSCIHNGQYLQVVQSGKNTFPGHPQAPGQHGKVQAVVGLQGLVEYASDQSQHLLIVSLTFRFIQGHIILIYEQNGFPAVMFMQKAAERVETVRQHII